MTCDECGDRIDEPHHPHDRDCPERLHRDPVYDCTCDNVVCPDCCWQCAEEQVS
jgi:hypothetical protein